MMAVTLANAMTTATMTGGSNSGESPSTAAEEEGPIDNASLKILCSLSFFSFLVSIFGGHEFLCLLQRKLVCAKTDLS